MNHGSCPGVPYRCGHAQQVITQALDGVPSLMRIDALRSELAGCTECVQALEFEIRFKVAMSQRCHDEAPASLQIRISETLRRIDLGDIDVSDL